ncbi:MAG: Type 1 glutamine amidotransferase-like domain-containing protein [bacterium]
MKKLFLTSEVQFVASDIGKKIDSKSKANAVYIIIAIKDKEHKDLEWHYINKSNMESVGFKFTLYDISGKNYQEIVRDLSSFDVMYIEGGNSYYLLQESQKNNFINFVNQRVIEGMIYISTSAGTVIAGPDIEPVRQNSRAILAPDLKGTKGYNLVDFVVMPHWGQEKRRELYNGYRVEHIYNEEYPYVLISDNQYVEVEGDWIKIIDVTREK